MIIDLAKEQPILYRVISNAIKNKHVSHCYLIAGTQASELLVAGKFIAKSLICQNGVACNNCIECLRIEEGNYCDYIFINGEQEKIKKDDVDDIPLQFSKSALEVAGKKIYLIHLLENATIQAVNSLLKFLEEPTEDVHAILTTANLSLILPTIISRAQLIRLKETSREIIIEEAIKQEIPLSDAKIIAQFASSPEEIRSICQLELYQQILSFFSKYLDIMLTYPQAMITYQLELLPLIKNKEDLRLLLSLLEVLYKDIFFQKYQQDAIILESLGDKTKKVSDKISDVDEKIKEIIAISSVIELNTAIALLLDKLFDRLLR